MIEMANILELLCPVIFIAVAVAVVVVVVIVVVIVAAIVRFGLAAA